MEEPRNENVQTAEDRKKRELDITYQRLFTIIYQRAVHLRENAMMYYQSGDKKEYEPVPSIREGSSILSANLRESITSRGKHMGQVALITDKLVEKFNGDQRAAMLMSLGHDFGHSTLAHTGEAPLGRFLLSPSEFKPWYTSEVKKARNGFDHSKHSLKALKKRCFDEKIELPQFIANGIEAHSSGDSNKSSVKHESLEAECVMRADKIASAISDTRDMILAGTLYSKDATDEEKMACLHENLNNNPEVRKNIRQRVFPNDEAERLEYIIEILGGKTKYDNEMSQIEYEIDNSDSTYSVEDIKMIAKREMDVRIKRMTGVSVAEAVEKRIEQKIDKYLTFVKDFIQNEPGEQREKLINGIVDETMRQNGGSVRTGYVGKDYVPQLKVPKDIEATLGALRGLLIGKENVRSLGKEGAEVEGLVETIARYIYAHPQEFSNHESFQYWKTDENGKECSWQETVAYSIAEFTDAGFKEFAISLLEIDEIREVLKHCKYRDPRDKALEEDEYKLGKTLEYSEADFSTKEAIERAFTIDKDRKYRPSISERRNAPNSDGFER